ncbi:Gustatory receptor 59 [Halyomorpha halys]|nr:Gustatory receptor 59 [Halyomorpha halys]
MAPKSITQSIQSDLIFSISTLFGMFPFRVIDNELKSDNILLLYSVLVSSSITIVNSYYFWETVQIRLGLSFYVYLSTFIYLTHLLTFLQLTFCFYQNRKEVVKTIQSIETLESFFSKIRVNVKRSDSRWKLLEIFAPILCGAVFFINILPTILLVTGKNYTGLASSFCVSLLCLALNYGQFIFFVTVLTECFQSTSKFLMELKNPVSFKEFMTVGKLVDPISQLVTASNQINKIYSKQLLIVIFTCYVSIMSHWFYIYANIRSKNLQMNKHHVPGDCLMVLYRIFVVWRLTHSAAQAKYESQELNTLVYQLMINDKNKGFLHNEKLRLHILMKREAVFTVCGFFDLDYTLLRSMIASATTYLVIMIQFGEP